MAHKLKKSKAQELLERLFTVTVEKTEKVPKGFYSVDEWCKKLGLGRSRASQYLAAGVVAGILEERKFRTYEKDRYYRRRYFREIV